MSTIEILAGSPWPRAVGWALLHSIWQLTALALLLAVARKALTRASAQARYLLGCAALAAMLLAPAATAIRTAERSATAPTPPAAAAPEPPRAQGGDHGLLSTSGPRAPGRPSAPLWIGGTGVEPFLPWLALCWASGVVLLSVRLAGGWLAARQLVTTGVRIAAAPWPGRLRQLAARLGVRPPVRLLQSTLVEVPTLVGWLRPAILLPVAVLTALDRHDLEAILAHELAHIRRRDVLVNLLQSLVETLLFFHPAVWWASRRVREERERCCDDLAVESCGDAVVYARALTRLEGVRRVVPTPAMAATGGDLVPRIRRLAQRQPLPRDRSVWPLATVLATLAAGAVLLAADVPTAGASGEAEAPAPEASATPEAAPAPQAPPAPGSEPTPEARAAPEPPEAPRAPRPERPARAPSAPRPPAPLDERSFGDLDDGRSGGKILLGGGAIRIESHGLAGPVFVLDRTFDDDLQLRLWGTGDLDVVADGSVIDDLEPGAELRLETYGGGSREQLVITSERQGELSYRFRVDGVERPFGERPRRWMAAALRVAEGLVRIGEIRGDRSRLRGEISALRGERSALRGRISSIRGERSSLRGQISALRGERSALRGRISSIRGELSSRRGEVSALRGQISTLRAQQRPRPGVDGPEGEELRRLAERTQAVTNREIEKLEGRIAAIEAELAAGDHDDRIAAVHRQIEALQIEEQVGRIERQIEELGVEARVEEIEAEIRALEVEETTAAIEGRIEALDVDRRVEEIERQKIEPALRQLREARQRVSDS